MLTYTSAELRTLSVNSHPSPRAVRKSLFTFHLWRPEHQRRRLPALEGLQHAKPSPVFNSATVCDGPAAARSADRSTSIAIGWLNAQSLRNKTDCIGTIVADRSLDIIALTETTGHAARMCCRRSCATVSSLRRRRCHLPQQLEVGYATASGLHYIRGDRCAADDRNCSFRHPGRLSAWHKGGQFLVLR